MKVVEMTGSPKDAGFSTKEVFLDQLAQYGYSKSKMSKRDNKVDILVTDSLESTSKKMTLARELNVEIMTYEDLAEAFDLEGDL
jgi:spore coat polysaccharide biosynthesis predicted glycosyltransferase SpsG